MDKRTAQRELRKHITTTAQAWRDEFDNAVLDPEWSSTAFQDISSEITDALDISWSEFHEAVLTALNQ